MYEDAISQALNAESAIESQIDTKPIEHTSVDGFEEKVKQFREQMATNATLDYADARDNIRELIKGAMGVFPDVLAAVEETRSDKAIMALNGFLKTAVEMNETLVDLNSSVIKYKTVGKDAKKSQQQALPAPDQSNSPTNIIVMNGATTTDLFEQAVVPIESRFQMKGEPNGS